jgi:hypothetical protein
LVEDSLPARKYISAGTELLRVCSAVVEIATTTALPDIRMALYGGGGGISGGGGMSGRGDVTFEYVGDITLEYVGDIKFEIGEF